MQRTGRPTETQKDRPTDGPGDKTCTSLLILQSDVANNDYYKRQKEREFIFP